MKPSVPSLRKLLLLMTVAVILKVTVSIVLNYPDYFPANFQADFLRGRESYFFSVYRWAFYAHIVSGPVALVTGLLLISDRFRRTHPQWHRYLGRGEVLCVLLVLAPSGLWMAYYAEAGAVAAVGFATLAVATAMSIAMGWRAAVQRRFADHRRWMWRCFALLCSAVVLRLIGGVAAVTGWYAPWLDQAAAWGCWMVPLAAFELYDRRRRSCIHFSAAPPPDASAPRPEISARRSSAGISA